MARTLEHDWAVENFGGLDADQRIVDRLVGVGTRAAGRPHGLVTQVFSDAAEREGAFRLLENQRLPSAKVGDAVFAATVARCGGGAVIAVDGTSLSLVERAAERGLGGVGAWKDHGRGLQVQSALAMDEQGVPIGLCGQTWWAREAPTQKPRKPHRSMEGETRHSIELLESIHSRFEGKSGPWYQFDRGYDVWPVLRFIAQNSVLATVRANGRRHVLDAGGRRRPLPDVLARARSFGTVEVKIPDSVERGARVASIHLRACFVQVPLAVGKRKRLLVRLGVVLAKEGRPPKGQQPVVWMLFTTHAIDTCAQVQRVLKTYTLRWRVEDFHRAWKDGLCRVERTQLRSREAIIKWATILAAVATRATRLTHLARSDDASTQPAGLEFTRSEIEAIVLLRKPRGIRPGHQPSIAEAVRWIADLGGYIGKSSGGPPGATVIGRGLAKVDVLAGVLPDLAARKPRRSG